MEIKELSRDEYDYYELHYTYTSDECYSCNVTSEKNNFSLNFSRYCLEKTYFHDSFDTLFQDTWQDPSAFGIFIPGYKTPVAVLEIEREHWNSRLRITQVLVNEEFRGKGFGKMLIDKSKEIAREENFRMLLLETQSCNTKAIDFYISQGFSFCGSNIYFYSNDDISENEVMLEMAYLL